MCIYWWNNVSKLYSISAVISGSMKKDYEIKKCSGLAYSFIFQKYFLKCFPTKCFFRFENWSIHKKLPKIVLNTILWVDSLTTLVRIIKNKCSFICKCSTCLLYMHFVSYTIHEYTIQCTHMWKSVNRAIDYICCYSYMATITAIRSLNAESYILCVYILVYNVEIVCVW